MTSVEMVRGEPHTLSYDPFACSLYAWRWLLALGRSHGWQPAGAIAAPGKGYSTDGYPRLVDPEYRVNEWRYAMRVTDEDALAWAAALRTVDTGNVPQPEQHWPALLSDDLDYETISQANATPREVIEGFVEFAQGGGFQFAIDD